MADLWTIQVLTLDFLLNGKILTKMMISDVTWTDPFIVETYYHHFGYNNNIPLVSLTKQKFNLQITW
jgi:hypothetical protein